LKSFPRSGSFPLVLACISFTATPSIPASAQNITQGAVHALSDWHSVEGLPAQTRIRIASSNESTICYLDSVTDDHITCSSSPSRKGTLHEFGREEVKQIKLTNRSRSTAVGAALGAGVGVAIGAAVGNAVGGASGAKPAGVGAAGGAAVGVLVGALFGHATDMFAGTVVYRRP